MPASSRKCPACRRAFLVIYNDLKKKTLSCPVCGYLAHKLRMRGVG